MPHTIVLGRSRSGKTTLTQQILKSLKNKGFGTLVLDPSGYAGRWDADYVTADPHEFLDVVFASERCAFAVDEAGEMIGRFGGEMNKLASRSAQNGHRGFFICQRAKMIDPTIRSQCENIITFQQSKNDIKDLSEEFVSPELLAAPNLGKLEYICKMGFDPAFTSKLTFDT